MKKLTNYATIIVEKLLPRQNIVASQINQRVVKEVAMRIGVTHKGRITYHLIPKYKMRTEVAMIEFFWTAKDTFLADRQSEGNVVKK